MSSTNSTYAVKRDERLHLDLEDLWRFLRMRVLYVDADGKVARKGVKDFQDAVVRWLEDRLPSTDILEMNDCKEKLAAAGISRIMTPWGVYSFYPRDDELPITECSIRDLKDAIRNAKNERIIG